MLLLCRKSKNQILPRVSHNEFKMRNGFVMVAIKKMVTKDEVISCACLEVGSVCDVSRRHILEHTASILIKVLAIPDIVPSLVFVDTQFGPIQ